MTKIEFLRDQIIETRSFINRLISGLPEELWYKIPEGTDSNFVWQIGHLLVSQNFHTLTVITGNNKKVLEKVPIPRYIKLFYGMGSMHRSLGDGLMKTGDLKYQFDLVHEICIENMGKLTDDILTQPLEPIPIKHPIAKTKYEALSWSFKHEMWHSAEMEDIKRALGYPIKWI